MYCPDIFLSSSLSVKGFYPQGYVYPFPSPASIISQHSTLSREYYSSMALAPLLQQRYSHSAHARAELHKLASLANTLQSANSFIHPLLLLLLHCAPLHSLLLLSSPASACLAPLSLSLSACLPF